MMEKDFFEYWAEVEKRKVLPQMAIQQVPLSLSVETKKKLMKIRPEETVEILINAINQINQGSIESIDSLIKLKL